MRDVEALARTIWGEARNQGEDGMEAVACVVLNRLKVSQALGGFWWGDTIADICQKQWQFSCWNKSDPNREKLLKVTPEDRHYAIALAIANDAILGALKDKTGNATHYCVKGLKPRWADKEKPTATIRSHIFYRPKEVPEI